MKGASVVLTRVSSSAGFDDATVAYAAGAQRVFQQLQDAASRLAAVLLAMSFERSRAALDHAARLAAVAQIAEGRDLLLGLTSTQRTAHFHRHMKGGLDHLTQTARAIDGTLSGHSAALDPLPLLQAAWKELEAASRCLPGFEVVDFSHSCCANHAAVIVSNT